MKNSLIKCTAIMVATLLASVAQAQNETVSSAGESKGDSWWVNINMPLHSYTSFIHQPTQNYVYASASARPNATLFGKTVTFLDVSLAAQPSRYANAASNTTFRHGFFQVAGSTLLNCSGWMRGTTVSCEYVKSNTVPLFERSHTWWVAGFIPVTVRQKLNLTYGISVVGKGTMNTLSNTTTSRDEAIARMSASGTLSADVLGFIGPDEFLATGLGGGVLVKLFQITGSGPSGFAQRTRSGATTGYRLESKVAGVTYKGLGGEIYFKACAFGECYRDPVLSWASMTWGNFAWDPKLLTRSLAATL
jgi:hypothetical protein